MCPAQWMTSHNISLNMPFNKIRYTGVSMLRPFEYHTYSVGFPQELFFKGGLTQILFPNLSIINIV